MTRIELHKVRLPLVGILDNGQSVVTGEGSGKSNNRHQIGDPPGFPGGTSGKEPACHCRRHKRCGFDPWIRKIPWRRVW